MTDLYHWYALGEYPPRSVFRTEDFRIWLDVRRGKFCLAYRSPLWSRLPVRRFTFLGDVVAALGFDDLYKVKGTIRH